MTRFYCLKCKKETETASEIQDMTTNGRYRLHGDCVICGMHKNTFTGVDWVFRSPSELDRILKVYGFLGAFLTEFQRFSAFWTLLKRNLKVPGSHFAESP
ncbi:hypothetical protein RhiirA4_483269 [Rhizophagus irregularis]|uniref:DUF5679 domain-containing protein n=1 Tax=Rhizophagus irregularis TaxID=588596 RepID=A0A2I1HMD1_9GLOM|nr:hypothetical protein RhiirA4_483269 [Rhizophagus irregularis]